MASFGFFVPGSFFMFFFFFAKACTLMSRHVCVRAHTCAHTLHAHLHPHAVEPHEKQWVVSGPGQGAPLRPVL